MRTIKLLTTLLTTVACFGTLAAGPSTAHACATPTKLDIESVSFPSWSYDVGGVWQALPNSGISQGYCYKQEAGINSGDQVLFVYNNMWYVAMASDCSSNSITFHTPMAAFYGATPDNPTKPDFVRSIRTMRIEVAADDAYYLSIDGQREDIMYQGQAVPEVSEGGHYTEGVVEREVIGYLQTVEIRAWDVHGTVAGMATRITVDGGTCGDYMTGIDDFEFATIDQNPQVTGASAPLAPHTHHTPPGSLGAAGAAYVWWNANASVLGVAEFSIEIDVP